MIYIAQELKRQALDIPLLIGGATTSKAHTAVKIAPELESTVVHVNDASRAVTVAGSLLKKKMLLFIRHKFAKNTKPLEPSF